MKSQGKMGLWIAALTACFVLPESATASLRWRVDGNTCGHSAGYEASPTQGLSVEGALGLEFACSIPIGPHFVDLGDGAHTLNEVRLEMRQEGATASFDVNVFVHDTLDYGYCSCGSKTADVAPGYVSWNMAFDCGECQYSNNWALTLDVDRDGPGKTTIKRISAYD